jgi:hypothetical protein
VLATGSFTVPLLLGAAISVLGAVAYWLLPDGPISAEDLGDIRPLQPAWPAP